MASAAARIAFAQGFGNPLTERYKQPLPLPTAPLAAGPSPRVPVGPADAIQAPTGRIPGSTQKPKRTNVAVPYTRTAPDQIDAGEIVLLNRHSAHNQSAAMNIGKGLNQLCTVATLERVNDMWKTEPPVDMTDPDDSDDPGAPLYGSKSNGGGDLPIYAMAWAPDGVSIAYDEEGGRGQPNLATVCVSGPTPLLNNISRERRFNRRAFLLNGLDGPRSRIYVGLRATRIGGTSKWTLSWERFSSGMIHKGQLKTGDPDSPLIAAWLLGSLTDNNLNAHFEKSGSIFVAMQSPLITRKRVGPRETTTPDEEDWIIRVSSSGPTAFVSGILKQTVEEQLMYGQTIVREKVVLV